MWQQILNFILSWLNNNSNKVFNDAAQQGDSPAAGPVITTVTTYKITKDELLKGRDKQYASEYTQEISDNLDKLLMVINKVRDAYGKPMTVNSGWRPPEINSTTPGAATNSKHMQGLAIDIADPNDEVMKWVLQNLQLMKDLNLFNEDFRWTPGWTHFGLGPPASGKRIFVPSANRPTAPTRWNGNYDHSFDEKP